ncbi:hypothetical protein SNEBB_003929 [Seison nebaliae]|nr:hypothetical protein SNEBB_003929 [Seison nebaliae]
MSLEIEVIHISSQLSTPKEHFSSHFLCCSNPYSDTSMDTMYPNCMISTSVVNEQVDGDECSLENGTSDR